MPMCLSSEFVLPGRLCRKPEDVAATPAFQEFHDLRRAVMTIAAHADLDPRPVVPDAADDVFQNPGRLFSGGPLAGAQERERTGLPVAASKIWMGWKQ